MAEFGVLLRFYSFLLLGAGISSCALASVSEETCGASAPPPAVDSWDVAAETFEDRVLELTNAQRGQGGCCGAQGCFAASGALESDRNLQAAARLHARDMAERNFFSHVTPDGTTLSDRLSAAGFAGCAAGENIAQGQRTPEEVVNGWLESDGHCANVLAPHFRRLGVGYVDDASAELRRIWVQNFGD